MARVIKNRSLGLDVGHHSIKAVEVELQAGGTWQVSGAAVAPTPPNAIADGVVAQPQLITAAVRDLLRQNNLQARQAYCSVSGPAVHFRALSLPRMNETQLRKAVQFKARETQTPTPFDELIVEFDVQESSSTQSECSVLMVAAPKAIVESRVDAVSDAGVQVMAVDLDSFALVRALVEQGGQMDDQVRTIAIVALGHSSTEFNIVTRGEFSFPRSIPIGGSHFNYTLQSGLGLDPAAVEEMKHLLDVRALLNSTPYDRSPASPEHLLRNELDELVREITRSINYYQSQFADGVGEGMVDFVLLCGGGARMSGIQEYMASRLRLEVRLADPLHEFFSLNASPEFDLVRDYSPAMACALGLALYPTRK